MARMVLTQEQENFLHEHVLAGARPKDVIPAFVERWPCPQDVPILVYEERIRKRYRLRLAKDRSARLSVGQAVFVAGNGSVSTHGEARIGTVIDVKDDSLRIDETKSPASPAALPTVAVSWSPASAGLTGTTRCGAWRLGEETPCTNFVPCNQHSAPPQDWLLSSEVRVLEQVIEIAGLKCEPKDALAALQAAWAEEVTEARSLRSRIPPLPAFSVVTDALEKVARTSQATCDAMQALVAQQADQVAQRDATIAAQADLIAFLKRQVGAR